MRVFAAASLEDALADLAAAFERESGTEVVLNFAGSNVLAQQIRAGAPADVFYSADTRWVDALEAEGRLVAGSRVELLGNRLVVVCHEDAGFEMDELSDLASLGFRYLSLGDPDAVPAGSYARAALQAAALGNGQDVWQSVGSRVVPAPDVRAALALVREERHAVGIVYSSDMLTAQGVKVLYEVPETLAPLVRYVAALVEADGRELGGKPDGGGQFLAFTRTTRAGEIFRRHGFLPLAGRKVLSGA